RRALHPRVEERFATAVEMREALADYLWSSKGPGHMRRKQEIVTALFEVFGAEHQAIQAQIKQYFSTAHGEGGGGTQEIAARAVTTTGSRRTPSPRVARLPEEYVEFDQLEDKTPVAPLPSMELLAHAGAPWFARHRYLLAAGAGVALTLVAF